MPMNPAAVATTSLILFGLMVSLPGVAEARTDGAAAPPNTEVSARAQAGTGFLSDYDRLEKRGRPRARYLVYTAAGADDRSVKRVYLQPVEIYPSDAVLDGVDPSLVVDALAYLDAQLRAELLDRMTLTPTPEQADVVVQVAVTAIAAQEKSRTLIDVVPMRLVTNAVKDAALGEAMVTAATLEVRITDAQSGAVLREALQHLSGEGIGRAGDDDTRIGLAELKPALSKGAKFIAKQSGPKL
jgi:hypothetical protein